MKNCLEKVFAVDSLKVTGFLKGTGFSPYIKAMRLTWALAPEGVLSTIRSFSAVSQPASPLP
jgi:hypothetical protein